VGIEAWNEVGASRSLDYLQSRLNKLKPPTEELLFKSNYSFSFLNKRHSK
jgi:hypothetical protein